MSSSESRSGLVLELAEEFLAQCRKGKRPSLKEYIDRHPDLAAEIKEIFPAMAMMENIAVVDDSLDDESKEASAGCPEEMALKQLGDYRVIREIGHGGMGVVYEAEQVSLGRHVALKVLPTQAMKDTKQKRRFEREARAAAKLHHTNIVPVFGVGEHDGLPYYVMQFIQGLGLDSVLDELKNIQSGPTPTPTGLPTAGEIRVSRRDLSATDMARSLMTGNYQQAATADNDRVDRPSLARTAEPPTSDISRDRPSSTSKSGSGRLSDSFTVSSSSISLPGSSGATGPKSSRNRTYWQSVASIGRQVADALEYAHKQGILHRDIKPSNLLLDLRGTVWVTDFGLAKVSGPDSDNLTHTGDVLGTLRYMPPEAFEGRTDARSDVYSLGLTLYELLALRPAYAEKDRNKLIKQVTTGEPPALHKINREVPRDLVTIIHKAIDREPNRRYASADHLASDLQRFIDDEPILARRQTNIERYWRWARHNPGIAILGAVLTAVLIVATVISLVVAGHMSRLAQKEIVLRKDAEDARNSEAAQRAHADENLRKAEENFARARAAVNDYLTAVSDDDRLKAPGLGALRAQLLQSALGFYQKFLAERGDDPSLRRELAGVYLKVADINSQLGRSQVANQATRQAQRLYELLITSAPGDPDLQDGLARSLNRLGKTEDAIAIWEKLIRPDSPRYLSELGFAYNSVALNYKEPRPWLKIKKDPAKELEFHRKALTVREQLVQLRPSDFEARQGLSNSLNNIAVALERNSGNGGREQEVLALYRRAVAAQEFALKLRPHNPSLMEGLVIMIRNTAITAGKLGYENEAIAAYERAHEVGERLTRDYPDYPGGQGRFLETCRMFLEYLQQQGRLQQADQVVQETNGRIAELADNSDDYFGYSWDFVAFRLNALRIAQQLAKSSPSGPRMVEREAVACVAALRQYVLTGRQDLAYYRTNNALAPLRDRADFRQLLNQVESLQKAERIANDTLAPPAAKLAARQQCLAAIESLAAPDSTSLQSQRALARARDDLANAYLESSNPDQARRLYSEALAIRERLVEAAPNKPFLQLELAWSQVRAADAFVASGTLADAVKVWDEAIATWENRLRADPNNLQISSAIRQGRLQVARRYAQVGLWETAIEMIRPANEKQTVHEPFYDYGLAMLLLYTGDNERYRSLAESVVGQGSFVDKTPDGLNRIRIPLATPITSERERAAMKSIPEQFEYPVDNWQNWIRAFTLVRLGDSEKGLKLLNQDHMPRRRGLKFCAQAIAHHQLGHDDAAQKALEKAERSVKRDIQEVVAGDSLNLAKWFEDWLLERILLREAYQLVRGKPLPELAYDRLHHGRVLLALGNADKAEAEFAAAVALRPNDADVWLARARLFARTGQMERMNADLAKTEQLEANDPVMWVAAARTLAELGQQKRAESLFARTSSLAKGSLNSFLQAGWWVIGPYHVGPAMGLSEINFSQLRNPDPSKPVVFLGTTGTLAWHSVPTAPENGRVEMDAIGQATSVARTYYCLAYVHAERDRTAALRLRAGEDTRLWVNGRLLFEGKASAPNDDNSSKKGETPSSIHIPVSLHAGRNTILVRAQLLEGDVSFCECQFEDDSRPGNAPDDYERLVKRYPEEPRLWIELGWHLGKVGRWSDAGKAFAKAVEFKPNDSPVWKTRALAYADLGKWDESAADFNRALELEPVTSSAWLFRSTQIYDAFVHRDEIFARVAKRRSNDRQLWIQRVYYLGRKAQWAEARKAISRVMELDPNDHLTWHFRASLRLHLGDIAGYRRDCHAMFERFGKTDSGLVAQRVAEVCAIALQGADDPAALTAMLARTQKDPSYGNWYEATVALCHYRCGRYDQAVNFEILTSRNDALSEVFALAVRAMAQFKLGQVDAASKSLNQAREGMARFNKPGDEELQPNWLNWIQVGFVLREAEALIPVVKTVAATTTPTVLDAAAEKDRKDRADRAATRMALALIQFDLGQKKEAEDEFRRLLTERAKIAAEESANPRFQADLIDSHLHLAQLLNDAGRVGEGLAEVYQAAASLKKMSKDSTAQQQGIRQRVAGALLTCGTAASRTKGLEEAKRAYRHAIALVESVPNAPGSDSPGRTAADWLILAMGRSGLGEKGQAKKDRLKAVELLKPAGATVESKPILRGMLLELGVFSLEARELLIAASGQPPMKLSDAIDQDPKNAENYRARGDWYIGRGNWRAAVKDYAEVMRLEPTPLDAMRLAVCLIANGDIDRYQEHCRAILNKWESTEVAVDAERVLKACLFLSDTRLDSGKLARLAQTVASGAQRDLYPPWRQLVKGLYAYRVGRFADAVNECRKGAGLASEQENWPKTVLVLNQIVEAMAFQRLGKRPEAADLLSDAKAMLDRHVPGADTGGPFHDWLSAHILYREAGELLTAKKDNMKK